MRQSFFFLFFPPPFHFEPGISYCPLYHHTAAPLTEPTLSSFLK
jgi:hypothetical protein